MKRYKMIGYAAITALLPLAVYANQSTTQPPAQTTSPPSAQKASEPIPIHRSPPIYPPIAQYENVQGSVQVCFTVEADGTLANLHIGKAKFKAHINPAVRDKMGNRAVVSASKKVIKAEALYTVSKWKFKPGYKDGKPVSTPNNCQTINFRLSG